MLEYRLTLGRHSIKWGESIDIDGLIGEQTNKSIKQSQNNGEWALPDGVYRAKDGRPRIRGVAFSDQGTAWSVHRFGVVAR
ncbi:hypothetical protein [Paenibacillus sp. IHBB 10380]|uniref:hypothetical protein n=1 Tax=Paenibacillus sp. IHBB 10380 TaxID=1566358 RepID=UPI0006971604|nr:hypothetical protein [Paenibacillus sp. IHBB 10380]